MKLSGFWFFFVAVLIAFAGAEDHENGEDDDCVLPLVVDGASWVPAAQFSLSANTVPGTTGDGC